MPIDTARGGIFSPACHAFEMSFEARKLSLGVPLGGMAVKYNAQFKYQANAMWADQRVRLRRHTKVFLLRTINAE
jgi:hypothetical protein